MYDEPYRWVEAVGNRRQYLDEQFTQGSPVIAVTYADGILLLTVSKGTPKLYEIYDRLALGGMGHPADLEKLRFNLLEMAHVEGFNRSPSDVTGGRMVKYGIAPVIKQAFEEVFKAPFIVKILLAELGQKADKDRFLTINYDGTFEERTHGAVLAANRSIEGSMTAYLQAHPSHAGTLDQAVGIALHAWVLGERSQRRTAETRSEQEQAAQESEQAAIDAETVREYVRDHLDGRTIECAVLDRNQRGSAKYRAPLKPAELGEWTVA
ncbi:MAG: putative Proteasome, alpha subunit [Nitrospira sp.]